MLQLFVVEIVMHGFYILDDFMDTDIDFGAEAFLKVFLEIRHNAGLVAWWIFAENLDFVTNSF